jgi:hypothetical protein
MSKLEKDGMRHIWDHRLKQPKVRSRTQRMPLVISEAHLSRLVLRYVSYQIYSPAILIQKCLAVRQLSNQMRPMKAVSLMPTLTPTRKGWYPIKTKARPKREGKKMVMKPLVTLTVS